MTNLWDFILHAPKILLGSHFSIILQEFLYYIELYYIRLNLYGAWTKNWWEIFVIILQEFYTTSAPTTCALDCTVINWKIAKNTPSRARLDNTDRTNYSLTVVQFKNRKNWLTKFPFQTANVLLSKTYCKHFFQGNFSKAVFRYLLELLSLSKNRQMSTNIGTDKW